ncbi:MAG: c-type cytochrome [Bacteroidia bacterium]|nr:c-type cytochrome [Bacteroidia bacterium]
MFDNFSFSIIRKLTLSVLTLLLTLSFSNPSFAQADPDAGKALFRANCAQCHNRNMKDDLTGPALGGTQERWAGREDILYEWIRNSQGVIASGDEYAVNLWNEWNKAAMNPYPNLTDQDIDNLLSYIDGMYTGTYGAAAVSTAVGGDAQESGPNNLIYLGIVALLAVIALILARVGANYHSLLEFKESGLDVEKPTLWEMLTTKGVIGFLIFAGIVVLGFTTVNSATSYGRQQGYQPEQPIAFSHETHAGLHKIDCQYCHDGARRSKHAVIPAANTCMNCHKAIKKGSTYGTAELTKIFASIGYDPSTDQYMENYESLSEEDIKAIFTKWIGNEYMKDNSLGDLDGEGRRVVETQWEGIKSSLTNDTKSEIPGPIEWVRIHNLPDHAYFNHAQHVSIGKVECQQCHGEVESMEVLSQYAPLSMGWCISCHRQTEVQFKGNEYYNVYAKYHEELSSGTRQKVTVEDIGGLECQKCHY